MDQIQAVENANLDGGQITEVCGSIGGNNNDPNISKSPSYMDTIQETPEDSESRPVTRGKLIPSQHGVRATLNRTPIPGPDLRSKSVPNENYNDDMNTDEMKHMDNQNNNETSNVLITELKDEDSFIRDLTEKGDAEKDDEKDSSFCSEEEQVKPTTDDEDDGWDTDLEIDDEPTSLCPPIGKGKYLLLCEKLGIVPASYFARHIEDKDIVMRNHGLGPAGAKAVARTLRDIITVEKLDLEDNWTEDVGGKYMARMLEENDYINEFNIAGNKLGPVGAKHMAKMLHVNTGLKSLNLSNNEFHENNAEYFTESLDENKTLKELYLARNNFSAYSGELLGPAIAGNDILEVLDLSWNRIRLKGAIAIAKGIKENVRLKTCNLSWNGFGPSGGVAIAEAIAGNASLLELDITGNRLDTNSALKIAKALQSNDSLNILKIGNNPISTAGCIAIITAVNNNENSSIEFLDLTDIPVEYEFIKTVEDLKKKRSTKVLYGPLLRSGNTSDDLGKRAVDPFKPRDPVIVLKEHLVVNDDRLFEVLKNYDKEGTMSVTPADFVSALQDLGVNEDGQKLKEIINKLNKTKDGKIFYWGNLLDNTCGSSV